MADLSRRGAELFDLRGTTLPPCQLDALFPADCVCASPSDDRELAGVVSCFAPHGLKNAAQDRVGLLTLGISEPFFTGAVMSEQLVLGRRDGRPIDKWVVRPHDATAQRLGAAGVGKP